MVLISKALRALAAPLACVVLPALPVLGVVGESAACAARHSGAACAEVSGTAAAAVAAATETEVEDLEEAEADMLDVRLIQSAFRVQHSLGAGRSGPPSSRAALSGSATAAAGASAATAEAVDAAASMDSVVALDHNGNVCMLCGKPLSERTGGRNYTEFRLDCGGRSSPTGPTAADLEVPAMEFLRKGNGTVAPSNGFCELNFAKSCADAVANQDYLYWPKSLNLSHPSMKANAPWDARYCRMNGFLEADIVRLQHNFTAMQAKSRELCETKYAKHGIERLTFLDMMTKSRYDDKDAPTREEAELLAAWNCAMGDLGCDMAMCAYSFCKRSQGTLGLYDECDGWDPVQGMPIL